MSINYKKVKQIIKDQNGNEKEIYYARACQRQRVKLDKLAERIASYCTLSSVDVKSVLIALTDTIPDYLLDNKSVELGDLGTISLHFTSESTESEDEVTWRSIKDMRVQFRAGKRIKKQLKQVNFKLVEE